MGEKNFKTGLLDVILVLLILVKEFKLSYAKTYKNKEEEK